MIKNPQFKVFPVNTVKDVSKKFMYYEEWITPENCPLKLTLDEPKIVELIKVKPGKYKTILQRMQNGNIFIPAPSNYLIGLGMQYPELYKEFENIISFDEDNVFPDEYGFPSVMTINFDHKHSLYLRGIAREEFDEKWWIAVIRK